MRQISVFVVLGIVYLIFHLVAMGTIPEGVNLYGCIPYLDKIQHVAAGAILAGFIVTLKRGANPFLVLFIVFILAMIFEVLEAYAGYGGDRLDTTQDVICSLVGAIVLTISAHTIVYRKA